MMFEMRYGAKKIHPDGIALEVSPKVISADKLAAARTNALRINLGCGHVPLDGYLNIDRRELPGVDIVAEAGNLPFGPGEIDEIVSAHLLEHFPQEQLKRELLPYWKSLLKPGGLFRAVVPDAEAMIREYSAGRYPYDHLRQVFYGAQDYDGDFHHNMFIPSHMSVLLVEAGFVDEKIVEAGRRNDICFEFEIAATKPAAS
jgi:predicted SAM-dependent methyltransferase